MEPTQTDQAVPAPQATQPARPAMDPVRKWVLVFCGFCAFLLVWYLFADRFTPFTTQARVNAFVVAVAPEVSGQLLNVDVSNNQWVTKGQRLAKIDPEETELALASAEAQLAVTQQNLKASSAGVSAAGAALESAKAHRVSQRQNQMRLHQVAAEDAGAISKRLVEIADASLAEAEASVAQAQANVDRAIEQLGPRDDSNPKLLAARAAVGQAKRNLRNTEILAPVDGLVTDLRAAVGDLARPGNPLMTFIAFRDLWVQADLTENNIGHVKPGDRVELVLDVWPGEVLRGKVRSITYGVKAAESSSTPGALPTIQNARDWMRDAQRFPVLIDLEDRDKAIKEGLRVGSQANVVVYTNDNSMLNALGWLLIRLTGILSYAY